MTGNQVVPMAVARKRLSPVPWRWQATIRGGSVAQKIVLLDDIDGTEAESTLHFSIEGTNYEIDLSEKNLEKFNEAMAEFVGAARVANVRQEPRAPIAKAGTRRRRSAAAEIDPKAVRAWAAANGIEVSPRGRVSREVIDKFRAAGN